MQQQDQGTGPQNGTPEVSLTVDGVPRTVVVEPRRLLVHALRDDLGVTGPHVGCETARCGACTVLLDGHAVKSCMVLAVQADGAEVTTADGLAGRGELTPLQESFREHHALQCGYCTPGMLCAATDFLASTSDPSAESVRQAMRGNLCRCTGYSSIVEAVLAAAPGEEQS